MHQTRPVTAVKWDKPPLPFVDPDTGEKIKLRLRKMSFAREVSSLPGDILELHKLLIKYRSNRNSDIYMIVSVWNKLRVYDKFWISLNFTSEEEYLAYYGLPEGLTLASWTIMVNLFDRATFVLLGDQVLNYMIRAIGQYQSDTDERKIIRLSSIIIARYVIVLTSLLSSMWSGDM